jgi:hypothetical protein
MAGVAGEASLTVTLGYDVAARPPGEATEEALLTDASVSGEAAGVLAGPS